MKTRACIVAVTLALVHTSVLGQVRTVTRTVARFGELERKLASANDAAGRSSFLAGDFEQRQCADPGTPVPRDQWLAGPVPKFSFHQEAVHDYGETAIYSALANDGNGHFLVVDTWTKQGETWKLAVRYLCPASGKKPEPAIDKRY